MSNSELGNIAINGDLLGTNAGFGGDTPGSELGTPGFEVGISAPTGDAVSSAGALAGDTTSSGGGSLGAGTWESISTFNPEEQREDDDAPLLKGTDPRAANPESGNIGQLLTLGTNPDGSHFFSGTRNVDAILIGSKWGTTNLTYSFPTSGSNYNGIGYDSNGVSLYHVDLGPQQQAAARAAFAQLSAATGLTFTEITDTDTVHANIRISQTSDQDDASAYGNFPSDTKGLSGDIWFGRNNQPYYDLAFKGTWGFATMMHEIGHTMGLKHGHQDYTNSDLSSYFGTFPRVGTQSLTPDRDGQSWSLMTYTPAPFTNSNFAGEKINQPQTYMQYDLAALQYLYGANYNTNAGDSVYTFSQTTGEMFINGVGQGAPSGNKIYLTIWDGGGNDTIDAGNYANGVTIDLRPGEFSTVDQAQLANNLAYQNLVNLAPGNFAMSLLYNNDARSLIENAKGGTGNDIFVGNTANNILDGGAGSDTVVFTNTTGVTVTLNDSGADVIVSHDGETDTLRSIENIQGTIGNDTLTGNSQNNTLSGGAGGTDVLSGGGGDDRLIGGGFTVVNNAIIAKGQADSNLSTASAIDPQARNAYTLVSDPNVTNSTTTPHATINATATGGGLEYYRVDVTAGATAIFDIDFSSIDTWIELVDSTGTTILANNDDSIADAGSSTGNSYLTYTFTTAGTYYVRVGRWTQNADTQAQPLAAGTTYTLNMSLSSATVNSTPFSTTNTSSVTMDGGEGNDFLQGTLGNDILAGGNGNDTASFATAFSNTATGVTVNLNLQNAAQNTGAAGIDTLTGIENLIGSQYNDTLTGDSGANVIEGGLGNDTLIGGPGDDTASYAGATVGVTVSLGLQGTAQNTIGAGTDTLSGFQNLLGSALNDTLTGDASENVITGGAGDDTLNPGANAAGNVDLLDGGIGTDTASFAGFTTAVTATLNGAVDGTASVGGQQIAALRSIENLTGGDAADILTGDSNANVIDGGLGDDVLDGGAGVDTLRFGGSTAVTVNLATTTAQNTGWGNDTILNIENVRTGSGADNITGDGNDNTFFDGGGADIYNGAGGADTVDYSAATSATTVNLNTTTAQNTGGFGGSDTITNIENVVGAAAFANTLTGNGVANRLTGGSAADTIVGNAGADAIFGGAGNDILLGGTSAALDDGSADVLEGGAGNDYLSGGQGNDILRGGDGDDSLIGGVGNTARQYFTGVDGGDDTFDGGDGTDTAILVYDGRLGVGASTVGIAFDLGSLAGNSAITFDGVNVGSLTSIESIVFRGTTVNDVVRATGTADNLTGGDGDDYLDGWYGNDLLSGGLGNDTLIGGEGLDTVTYVNATAGVNVDLRIDGEAQNTGGEGVDTLSGIEYLTGSSFGDTLRGTDDFNLITDTGVGVGATALSQTDSLFGYGGNDSILVTRGTAAAAVATNINMDGGDGDDFIELRGGTVSTALATNTAGLIGQTYLALGATSSDRNVDVVTVDGGAGNDRIILTGVASATINAGSGADIVSISMRGATSVNNYLITLGTGADIIQLGVGTNAATSTEVAATARTNRVTDFERGNAGDKFELTNFLNFGLTGYTANSNAFASGHLRLVQSGADLLLQSDRDGAGATNAFVTVFTIANGYTGGFTAFNFDGFIGDLTLTGIGALDETLTGATGNDSLSGGDGNDTLIGLSGNDTLDGGNGDDQLWGGAGDDTLIGGAGIDTAVYSDATVGVTVNLSLTGAQATGMGTDTLGGIENLIGSAFSDVLTGDAGANRIEAGAGDDNLSGAGGNDVLIGGDGIDTLDGGDGDDTLWGGTGDDTLIGGIGTDTAVYSDAMTGVTVDLSLLGAQATGMGLDTLSGIENLVGSAFGDILTGDAGANRIDAGAGNDTVSGGAGDDVLIGGDGIDTLYYGNMTAMVQVNLVSGQVNGGAQGGLDQVSGFERVILGSGNDLLIGDGADNFAEGGMGDDQLFGAEGNDQLYGGDGTDQLFGGVGNDVLDGGQGADFLNGGAGDDVYVVDNAGDEISEFGGSGVDTVRASISYVLGSGLENLTLTGTGAINATGNDDNNVIVGNAGRNTLMGGGGNDTIATVVGAAALKPDAGFDRVDGGSGTDLLALGGFQSDYHVLNAGDRTFLVTAGGATEVTGIEQGAFTATAAQSWSSVVAGTAAFDGLSYIAGYSDLRAAFGTDAAAGVQHFLQHGFEEGRALSFNALDYIASYSDLRAAFGADATAGAQHFILHGATESRDVSFDGWAYLASYSDLIQAFGPNETAAAQHFILYGAAENRATTFDALAYAAANSDVATAFGTDEEALARHYVLYGYGEGRSLGVSSSVASTDAFAASPAAAAATVVAAFAESTAGHGYTGAFEGNAWLDTTHGAHAATELFIMA